MQRKHLSPRYTTNLCEIPTAKTSLFHPARLVPGLA
ncbi:DUF4113 domain-containing protein [Aeromonas veronii]